MTVFTDYVNRYSDLTNAYLDTGTPSFSSYVSQYADLAKAYQSDVQNKNWDAYVWTGGNPSWSPSQGDSDLEKAWQKYAKANPIIKGKPPSKAEWGINHYNTYGSKEGRQVPFQGQGSTILWNADQWGSLQWENFGKKEGRVLPKQYAQTVEEWGRNHWITNGKNEDRILSGAKLAVNSDGQLSLQNTDTIGAGAQKAYTDIVNKFNSTQGGDYKQLMESLGGSLGDIKLDDLIQTGGLDALSGAYTKKVSFWDSSKFGAQPPVGGFDPEYYEGTNTGQQAIQKWNEAQQGVNVNGILLPDLDITVRYNQESFLHKYYTDVGKSTGDRGNAPIDANLPKTYEEKLTDADYQLYRDQVLGLASEQYPQTVLEGSLGTVLTAKDKQKQQMFGALTQDSLKASIEELKKAKKQESTLSLFRGLPGYDEIFSLNTTLSNSLLGDSGVGGLLSITKNTEDVQKSLEKSLGNITGINTSNSAVYNWQQWFDNVLLKRYENGLTVQDPSNAEMQYEIDKEFAGKFISDYLKPRFDTSRSMDEFISYMDVTQKEENIFQTQSALDSLRTLADVRAKAYLDGVQGKAALNFNPDFYFNPGENEQRAEAYAKQAAEVAADWDAAKKGDPFWAAEAYRYGIDLNDKAQFAKLHYEVKGAKQGFDAARDVITLKDAKEYIDKAIIPAVEAKEIALGDTAFLQFVTPEEFADKLIEGISPEENKEEWLKLLEQFGLKDTGQSVDELKNYIVDALRTGAAKDIRESIKYLNEKKKTPSQEELGVSYIERPEDKKTLTSQSETQLYKVFKDAGYQGTEDEFYTTFMPDVDRSEQVALTKAGAGSSFDFKGLDTSDPFAALMSVGSLFEEPSTTKTTSTTTDKTSSTSSYFKLFEDETEDEALKKSKTGQQILGEFTSMFKGFT